MNEDVFNASIRKFLKANKVASLDDPIHGLSE